MRKKIVSILTIMIFAFLLTAGSHAAADYPSATDEFFVNDFAGVLDQDTERSILQIGKTLEELTTAQVVVVTIGTLDGQDIDSYANELFRRWGIGQKDKNNGVLILDAVQDRVLRIEVGYGLEGALTDIETAKIRKEYMNPYLAQGDHSSGMLSGYIAVVNEVAGEYGVSIDDIRQRLPSDSKSDYDFYRAYQPESRRYGGDDDFFPTIAFVFIFLAVDGIFFRFRITQTLLRIAFYSSFFGGWRGGRGGRGGWGGGGFGGFGGAQ